MKKNYYSKKAERAILTTFVIIAFALALGIPEGVRSVLTKALVLTQEVEEVQEVVIKPVEAEKTVSVPIEANTVRLNSLPSQSQKDATARVCLERYEGELATRCYYDLLAISWKETRYNCSAIGDQGRSYGCYQIQYQLHGISIEEARDYEYASRWTLNYLVQNSYPLYRTHAIQCHNGCKVQNGYKEAVKRKSNEFEKRAL